MLKGEVTLGGSSFSTEDVHGRPRRHRQHRRRGDRDRVRGRCAVLDVGVPSWAPPPPTWSQLASSQDKDKLTGEYRGGPATYLARRWRTPCRRRIQSTASLRRGHLLALAYCCRRQAKLDGIGD